MEESNPCGCRGGVTLSRWQVGILSKEVMNWDHENRQVVRRVLKHVIDTIEMGKNNNSLTMDIIFKTRGGMIHGGKVGRLGIRCLE